MARSEIIRTERLVIEPFSDKHLTPKYLSWLNNQEVLRYSEQRHKLHTMESCRAYLESFEGSANYFWSISVSKDAIGQVGTMTAYLDAGHKSADIGILIGERDAWGKGYGLEAFNAACGFLFRNADLRKITAGADSQNKRMIRLMKRVGMIDDGGKEAGIVRMALSKEDFLKNKQANKNGVMITLLRLFAILRQVWGRVKDYTFESFRLYFRGLSVSEKRFIKENSKFWASFPGTTRAKNSKYIFVRPEYYPLILVGNAHISAVIAAKKNCRLLFLLRSRFDRTTKKVLSSFPNASFEYQDSLRHFFYWILSYFDARRAMPTLRSPEDLLAFSVEGLGVGDLIYDSYLNCGYATLSNMKDPQLFLLVRYFFFQKRIISGILGRYNFFIGLTGHNAAIDAGVFMRLLLKNNIPVWVKSKIMKKYYSLSNLYEDTDQPDGKFFEYMSKRKPYFVGLADSILDNRMTQPNSAFGADLAYHKDKVVYSSREDFAKRFSLDPRKKNVFVMLSIFNDGPHMCGPLIFNDYYHWFREVLKYAQKDRSVNWIFKEHPFAWYYKIRDTDMEKIFAEAKEPHILYLRERDSLSTASLRYIADVILSCFGTAGLEFSCFGIPCVLAGKCHYSPYGFTISPKTREEFYGILSNIGSVERLSEEKIAIAKLIAFFAFEMCNLEKASDPFRTIVTLDANEQVSIAGDKVFETIIKGRNASTPDEKKKYILAIEEFISNPRFMQFIDLDKYGFRDALQQEEVG